MDGDWGEVNYTPEFWPGDPNMRTRPSEFNAMLRTLTRRERRDAQRRLRGNALWSELHAKMGRIARETLQRKGNPKSAKFIDEPAPSANFFRQILFRLFYMDLH